MYYELKNEQNPQRAKRLAFAQQIRRRSRNSIINQIRIDFNIREKVWAIISQPQIDTLALYTIMQKEKIDQYNASVVVAEWLMTESRCLVLDSKRECLHWGFILNCVMEYKSQLVQKILQKYMHYFIQSCIQFEDLQIMYAMICCILNIILTTKREINEQILRQSIQKTIRAQMMLIEKTKINIFQLQFCSRVMISFPKYAIEFSKNINFIKKLLQFFESNIDKVREQFQIIRILIFFTYYDGQLYQNFTIILLENNVLQHAKFILEFMEVDKYQSLVSNTLTLIQNIVLNLGAEDVLESGLWQTIKGLFQGTFTYNKMRKDAIHCYFIIIENAIAKESQLQKLREGEAVKNIVQIVDRYAGHDEQIVKHAVSSLQNLLKIGQEIKQCNELSVNPYGLALKYTNSTDLLRKYQLFDELFDKYHIYF